MQKPDYLIRTKYRPPFIRPELVTRPRLQERIVQGLQGPLTLLVAPAGFGKTTLVVSSIHASTFASAWLSLDKDDNQPGHFLSYLIAALQETDPAIGVRAEQLLTAAIQAPTEAILASLVNDLESKGNPTVLVLDDYQFINRHDVHAAVAFLLDHCPHSFHIVIASRSDPPLPLARLRARGQMVELRTANLRFSEDEAAKFLNEVMGLHLDARSVAQLEERTEGWIAGLQMAALSMRNRADIRGFVDGFSGTNRYILDYLLEEVLANQKPEIQQFLLCTSILDRLTAPLCSAVVSHGSGKRSASSADDHAGEILAYLEKANLFLVPLDDERIWYRYHHLFADLLRAQLSKTFGEPGVASLHLEASTWFEQSGYTLDAIYHASLAGDNERVERLIEQNYIEMMNHGEMSWVRFWMGKLSRELVLRRPWLCLYESLNHSWFGELDEAEILLDAAENHIQSNHSAPDYPILSGYHAYVRSRVTAMRGNTGQAIELCRSARSFIPADKLGLQIDFGITLGYEYFLYGDFEYADSVLREMIQTSATAGAINNPVAGYAVLARMKTYQGRLREAEDILKKASQLIPASSNQYRGVNALLEVGNAALLYEWDELEPARTLLEHSLDYLPLWGKIDDLCLAYVTLARIYLALRNQDGAVETIVKASQLVKTCGIFSEARSVVEAFQVRLWLAQENESEINHWIVAQAAQREEADPSNFEKELIGIAQARVLMARGNLDEAIQALSGLEERAKSAGRNGRLIEILNLKALALLALGDTEQAELALSDALTLAEPEGYLRIYLEEGRSMQRLLDHWISHTNPGVLRDYACRLSAGFENQSPQVTVAKEPVSTSPISIESQADANALIEHLSQRELEVLHHIALGRTNQEIALLLFVSKGTIKAHAASIYRKLDVSNRTEAVARARRLGILP